MSSYSSENSIFDLLLKVANDFGYELFLPDQIVFKKGEIGDRFYIILRGRVSVLVAEENTINLSELEYISYLLRLKKYGENEILLKSISINHGIYKSISEEFDKFLRDRECDINKLLKSLPFEIVKEYEDTVSYLNHARGKDRITVNEYIKRISVEIDKVNKPERKTLTIYVYNNLLELSEGDKFGDFSLTFDLKKRYILKYV
jgi:CRP-like cAMP-binding protein